MQAFELTILNWIQAHLRCGVLDAVMVPVSRICDHGEVWILLAAILLAIPKTRKLGTCMACGLALDLLFCNLALKPLIGRVRPFAVNPTVSLLIPPPADASFPSGHTAVAFCGATVLHKEYGKVSPWISVAGYAVATATAVDRVRRNRHRWGDVAAGAAIGFLSAEAGYWIVEKIAGKKKNKVDDVEPSDDEQKVQIGVSPDGLAMVIKL